MAHIIQQQLVITLSKLVKQNDSSATVVSDEELVTLIHTVNSVVEQLLNDAGVIVEVEEGTSLAE